MAGTEYRGNIAIIPGALILIPDQEGNGGSGGFPFEYTGKDFNSI